LLISITEANAAANSGQSLITVLLVLSQVNNVSRCRRCHGHSYVVK